MAWLYPCSGRSLRGRQCGRGMAGTKEGSMRHSLPDTAGTTKGKVRGDGFPYILETQLNFRVRKGERTALGPWPEGGGDGEMLHHTSKNTQRHSIH